MSVHVISWWRRGRNGADVVVRLASGRTVAVVRDLPFVDAQRLCRDLKNISGRAERLTGPLSEVESHGEAVAVERLHP